MDASRWGGGLRGFRELGSGCGAGTVARNCLCEVEQTRQDEGELGVMFEEFRGVGWD